MIIKCQCCCSILEVEYDEEIQAYDFVLWERGHTEPMSFKERLRWCWDILRRGNPWSDHTIISKEDFEKLRSFQKGDEGNWGI